MIVGASCSQWIACSPMHNGSGGWPLNSVVSRHRELMSAAIPYLVPCAIIAAASIPLILRIVPPNRLYGFRTQQTLSNRELWFRANYFAGWALLIAAGTSAGIFAVAPEYASGRSALGLVVFVVPLVIAVVASLAYLRRVAGSGQR